MCDLEPYIPSKCAWCDRYEKSFKEGKDIYYTENQGKLGWRHW